MYALSETFVSVLPVLGLSARYALSLHVVLYFHMSFHLHVHGLSDSYMLSPSVIFTSNAWA